MMCTQRAGGRRDEDLQDQYSHLKRHQICWYNTKHTQIYIDYFFFFYCLTGVDVIPFDLTCRELIKLFPGRKILKLGAATTAFVTLVSASRAVKEAEKLREVTKT
jgi:hypothetical protein